LGEFLPNDINETDHVVGNSPTLGAVLWDGTTLHDLDTLVDPADLLRPYVSLKFAWGINDRGDIAAEGTDDRTGKMHAFLVSPITPAAVVVTGFEPPVDGLPTLNMAQAGQAIPLKFTVRTMAGAPVLDLANVRVLLNPISCGSLGVITGDEIEQYAAGQSGLQNLGAGRYQFNVKIEKGATGCHEVSLALAAEYAAADVPRAYLRLSH
jgi:hypothetical protein